MKLRFNFSPENLLKKTILLMFLISIAVKINADLFYYSNGYYPFWSSIRHVLFAALIVFSLLIYLGLPVDNRGKWERPMLIAIGFSLLYIFVSIILAVNQNRPFIRAFEMSYMQTSSIVLVYCFINIYTKKELSFLMRTTFCILTFQYILSNFNLLITPQNFLEIRFFDSYSPFESSLFSGYIYGLFIYFTLFDENKFFVYSSFIVNFLVFKRINVLVSVVLLLFGNKISYKEKSKNFTKWILIIIFTFLPILAYEFMIGTGVNFILELFPQFDVQGLFMGRDWFLKTLLNSNYESYGLGSAGVEISSLLRVSGLELDGITMYLELGFLGVFGVSYTWWNFTESNKKNIIIVLIFMINYLTSWQLADTYAVFFNVITMALISNYGCLSKSEEALDYVLDY